MVISSVVPSKFGELFKLLEDLGPQAHIIKRLRAGEMEMLSLLRDQFRRDVYRCAFSIVMDEEVAEDIAEDTFICFYEKLSRFNAMHSVLPWLKKIARNRALNWVKRVQHRQAELLEDIPDPSSLRFDDFHDRFDLRRLLDQALGELKPKDRELVLMYFAEEMPTREIASRMGRSENAVRIRAYRALRHLRRSGISRDLRDYYR